MFCPKCGAQIADQSTVCSHCGAPLAAQSQVRAVAGAAGAAGAAGVATDRVKAASKDAFRAFLGLVSNPVGGLAPACESLQPNRTLGAGIVFGVAFLVLFAVGIKLGAERIMLFGMGLGADNFFRVLIGAAVPFLALTGAAFGLRSIARGKGGLGEDAFLAGASLLPFGFAVFLAGVLGLGNLEVILLLFVFTLCFTVMMLFAGLTRIYGLSDRTASIGVPVMFLVSGWLSKVIYSALMPSSPF